MHPNLLICSRAGGVPRYTDTNAGGTAAYLHTRHLLESTHTNTHKHKQTHNAARQSTVWTHAVAAPRPHQRRAPRPHPQQAASLSRSPTPKLCAPPPKGAVPAARATSTSTSSLRSRTAVSLAFSNPHLPLAGVVLAAWDFSKSPRSNLSLRGRGRLDFLKSPRSNPPLLEGRLDVRKSPRSNPPHFRSFLSYMAAPPFLIPMFPSLVQCW